MVDFMIHITSKDLEILNHQLQQEHKRKKVLNCGAVLAPTLPCNVLRVVPLHNFHPRSSEEEEGLREPNFVMYHLLCPGSKQQTTRKVSFLEGRTPKLKFNMNTAEGKLWKGAEFLKESRRRKE